MSGLGSNYRSNYRPDHGQSLLRFLFIFIAAVSAHTAVALDIRVERHTSPGGHIFWYSHKADAEQTAIQITWLTPPDYASPVPAALGHVVTNMYRDVAHTDLKSDGLKELIADLGGELKLSTGTERTDANLLVDDDSLTEFARLTHISLTNPVFDPAVFEKHRALYLDGLKHRRRGAWGKTWDLALKTLFKDHMYREFIHLHKEQDLAALTPGDAVAWRKTAFTSDQKLIAAVSKLPPGDIGKALDTIFAELPKAVRPPVKIKEIGFDFARQTPKRPVLFHVPDAKKSTLLILSPLPAEDQGLNVEINFSVGVLGVSDQSRLFKAVRNKLRASYGFGAWHFSYGGSMTRLMYMSGEVETDKLAQTLKMVEDAYRLYRSKGIGRLEFPIARRYYKRELAEAKVNEGALADILLGAQINGQPPESIENLMSKAGNMSRRAVNTLIKTRFRPWEDQLIIAVSPKADAIPGACLISKPEQIQAC